MTFSVFVTQAKFHLHLFNHLFVILCYTNHTRQVNKYGIDVQFSGVVNLAIKPNMPEREVFMLIPPSSHLSNGIPGSISGVQSSLQFATLPPCTFVKIA